MIDIDIVKKWILEQLKARNIIIWLIAVNVALYLVGLVINILGMPFGYSGVDNLLADTFSRNWLYVPPSFGEYIRKAYTIITYQFLHYGIFHLLSNMFILFYFGNTFITLTHKKKLLSLYVYGGIFSAAFFLLVYNLNPVLSHVDLPLVGASGSVMAILAAVVTLIPDREILFFGRYKIKYKWIAFFFIGLNLIGLRNSNAGGNYAHLGGMLFGFIFVTLSRNGIDLSRSFNLVFNQVASLFVNKKEPKISFVNDKFKDKKSFQAKKKTNFDTKENQTKLNAILDKVRQSGYDKLTKAEKEFLFNNSKK